MHRRVLRRAVAATISLLVIASLMAFADTVPADGDAITPDDQTMIDLGHALPGDVLVLQVTFRLKCDGTTHATPGSTIDLTFDSAIVPGDGAADASGASIGPVPADWAANGCTTPPQSLPANGPSTVSLTMPSTAGDNQDFTLMWARSGSSGLTGMTTLTFRVDVLGNTPPTLHLPGDLVVEATSAAGAVVTFSATATDAEDSSPPSVTCTPASGSTFPIDTTTVKCSTKDSGGLTASGSFHVTVADTTAPAMAPIADIDVTTTDPAGATVAYGLPSVSDAVDPAPTVHCSPASGTTFSVGTTTVTCTALDAFANESSMTFRIRVTLVSSVVWSAIWGEPVATDGSTFVANAGRNVPVKVRMFADGVEQTSGSALLTVATCAGANVASVPMTWGGGRWNGALDTSSLGGPGCYAASASLDGQTAGSFRLDLRGSDPAVVSNPRGKNKS